LGVHVEAMARALKGWSVLGRGSERAAGSRREPTHPGNAGYRLKAVRIHETGRTLTGAPHRDGGPGEAVGVREPLAVALILLVDDSEEGSAWLAHRLGTLPW
jgi:hypothetical protein